MINHIDAMLRIHEERMERLRADVALDHMLKVRREAVPFVAIGVFDVPSGHNRRDGQAAWRRLEMRPRRRMEFEPT